MTNAVCAPGGGEDGVIESVAGAQRNSPAGRRSAAATSPPGNPLIAATGDMSIVVAMLSAPAGIVSTKDDPSLPVVESVPPSMPITCDTVWLFDSVTV